MKKADTDDPHDTPTTRLDDQQDAPTIRTDDLDDAPTVRLDDERDADTVATIATSASSSAESQSMAQEPAARVGFGLGMKFFVGAALLVLATLGTTLAVTSWRANQVAERSIREGLKQAPAMFRAYRADLEARLKAQLRSAAESPGTKALYAEDVDVATVYEYARDLARDLEAANVFLFDQDARVIARADRPDGQGRGKSFGRATWVREPLTAGRDASAAIIENRQLSLVAAVAVTSGEGEATSIDGVLAAVYPFGRAEVLALEGIMRGQVAFLTDLTRDDEAPDPIVTAVGAGLDQSQLRAALDAAPGALSKLLSQGQEVGPLDVTIADESRLLLAVPVKSASGTPYGAFVITRSREQEMAAFREIETALLAIGGLLLLASFPVSFFLGRGIAKPLEQLAHGARRIRDGKLDVRLPHERRDEVGALARAFGAMVDELKEKRALQDLLEERERRTAESHAMAAPTAELAAIPGASLEIGKVFGGRYEILGTLGVGGMGAVYHSKDIELDDVVALKVLKSEAFRSGSQALDTLKREIRLARKITHPNVVRVHDFADAGGIRFISMEYVPGTTLRELLKAGALSLRPGLQVAKQLCRGLGAIHTAGILHRDMKPENVMVLPNGMLKLMDFGIAAAIEDVSSKKGNALVGTPRFMSPEQLKNESLDARSDLYAVGVMMYEMFSGKPLFVGKTLNEIVQQKVMYTPPSPKVHRPDLPDALATLIMRCLERDRAARPENAKAVLAGLMAIPSK